MASFKIFILSFILLFTFGMVFAQEEGALEVTEAIDLDENIQPQDLGVSEPRLLPDSPFYFLKNWGRSIQAFYTLNSLKKAELRMKFANEKLIEAKKLVELKKNPEIIQRAIGIYQQEVEKMKNQADRIKEKARENSRVESFLNKFIHQQILHQKLLQRLETQAPAEAFEKIKTARERHLENFQDVMLKLEDREDKITEKLEEILEKQRGSQFKNFKNLEILKELEEKVPEKAKDAILKAQENTLQRLITDLEQMAPADLERFKEYTEKISGKAKSRFEILESLKREIRGREKASPKLLEKIGEMADGEPSLPATIGEGCLPPRSLPADQACIQVVVYAKNPGTGECCLYANPCVAPSNWPTFNSLAACQEGVIESLAE